MKRFVILLISSLMIFAAGSASAKIFSEDTVYSFGDAPVYDANGFRDTNFDEYGLPGDTYADLDSELWTGTFSGLNTRSYLAFDLSGYAGIQGATLYMYQGTSMSASDVSAYSTSAFNESTITWNNQPGLGSFASLTNVGNTMGWYAWDVSSLAQLAAGGNLYLAMGSNGTGHVYYASETQTGYAPYLAVTAVPEPISTALFVLGGATLAVRRIRRKK